MRNLNRYFFFAVLMVFVAAVPTLAMNLVDEHSEFEGPFEDGPAVTALCLECHDDVAEDFMKTSHWTWEPMQNIMGKGEMNLGKKNTVNNFCIALSSNWARCTSCHAGYGWKDDSFDFTDATLVDCLVCHDRTGTYKKFPTSAGHPNYEPKEWQNKIWEPVDLASIARSVGMPSRANCGACHFQGGGGNNVKHGDMEKALVSPPIELDVHMSPDGQNFTCQECHTTENHDIQGNAMFASPSGYNHLECTSCHDEDLHAKPILNWHGQSIACQTCHIPAVARANPTKTWWDWSTAGTDVKNVKDEYGMNTFDKKKGTFKWEKNVVPTYVWYDGVTGQYILGDDMNPNEVTKLNWPMGNRTDPKSKIYPFKVMRGKQVYDKQTKQLLVPKLFGAGGLWKNGFDWNAAIVEGSMAAGMEYSGEYGFAETVSYWKSNHMVAQAKNALKCKNCHPSEGNSRMDWAALGYSGDPSKKRGISRYELENAYREYNRD